MRPNAMQIRDHILLNAGQGRRLVVHGSRMVASQVSVGNMPARKCPRERLRMSKDAGV